MALNAAVTPSNSAFAGGTLAPASNPLAVGGTIGGPGSAAAFPNVPGSQILSARNNSGSNIRVPYARLVPLRSRTTDGPGAEGVSWNKIPGLNTRANFDMTGRIIQNEYDGLESGELAWILGRRLGGGLLDRMAASAHGLGMGYGPDRMQRLCYTSWMEAYFRASHGSKVIALNALSLNDEFVSKSSHQIRSHRGTLAGATVLESADVPHLVNKKWLPTQRKKDPDGADIKYSYHQTPVVNGKVVTQTVEAAAPRGGDVDSGLASGIFVMEEGPFLRGKIIEDMPVNMIAPELNKDGNGKPISHTVSRNLGDECAFEALYAKMREMAMFDWTPDGMVLSKLESPGGDTMSSSEIDARQGQLFNLAIQGPAIAKTWTGDPLQQTMPMDRVFICIVADVQSTVQDDVAPALTGIDDVAALVKELKNAKPTAVALERAKKKVEKAISDGNAAVAGADDGKIGQYAAEVRSGFKNAGVQIAPGTEDDTKGLKSEDAFKSLDLAAWREKANKLRCGKARATSSEMCNFRLVRATSSYLAQYSRARTKDGVLEPKSRCGLQMGLAVNGDKTVATAQYIVGAWCIGTVIDNAASRSTVGHLVRIAPASMAININVNIEWWGGDKLYRHYMDTDRGEAAGGSGPTVQTRVEHATGAAQLLRKAGLEMPLADLPEVSVVDQGGIKTYGPAWAWS